MKLRSVLVVLPALTVTRSLAFSNEYNQTLPSNITYHFPSPKQQEQELQYKEDDDKEEVPDENDNPSYKDEPEYQNDPKDGDDDHYNDPDRYSPPESHNPFEYSECHDIHQVPLHDQCQFTTDYCEDYTLGFLDYLGLYYCNVHMKTITFFAYITFLIILFTTLGLTASEFLCPNLDSISKIFRMSESLTGVTLLALGNGSPDVFGTLEAVKANATSLAVGELIGAALFITCCVVGSMAIVRPFKVAKKPFMRDVLFLLVGLIMTVIFLHNGEITLLKAFFMILIYLFYVLFVVLWDYIMVKRRKRQLFDQKVRNSYLNDEDLSFSSNYTPFTIEENNELNDDEILESLRITNNGFSESSGIEVLNNQFYEQSNKNFQDWNLKSLRMFKNKIRPSLFTAIELNNQLSHLNNGTSASTDAISLNTIHTSNPKIKLSSAPEYRDLESDNLDEFDNYESRTSSHSAPAAAYYDGDNRYRDDLDDDDVTDPGSPITAYNNNEQVDYLSNKDFLKNFFKENVNLLKILFPSLVNFKDNSLFNKAFLLVCLPLVTILRLTIPVVETVIVPGSSVFKKAIDLKSIWVDNFALLLIQCLVSPLITSFLMFECYSPLFTSLVSFILITFFIFVRSSYNSNSLSIVPYSAAVLLSIVGFIISINWISIIATELISLIKFFSILFNLSDSILGLTVFAMGNSLGDLISNFTIAKMGFPMMAMSACFGGPLLNILLGIGFSANYVILTDTEQTIVTFQVSKTLIISCAALFVNLVFLLIMVPLNRWEMNAKIGYTMIGFWSTATFICVILEILS